MVTIFYLVVAVVETRPFFYQCVLIMTISRRSGFKRYLINKHGTAPHHQSKRSIYRRVQETRKDMTPEERSKKCPQCMYKVWEKQCQLAKRNGETEPHKPAQANKNAHVTDCDKSYMTSMGIKKRSSRGVSSSRSLTSDELPSSSSSPSQPPGVIKEPIPNGDRLVAPIFRSQKKHRCEATTEETGKGGCATTTEETGKGGGSAQGEDVRGALALSPPTGMMAVSNAVWLSSMSRTSAPPPHYRSDVRPNTAVMTSTPPSDVTVLSSSSGFNIALPSTTTTIMPPSDVPGSSTTVLTSAFPLTSTCLSFSGRRSSILNTTLTTSTLPSDVNGLSSSSGFNIDLPSTITITPPSDDRRNNYQNMTPGTHPALLFCIIITAACCSL